MECGLKWAVSARRKGRDKQEEQWRQAKQREKTASKASKSVSAKNNKQLETGAENREPQVMGGTTEARTGRRGVGQTRPTAKIKEKGMGEKVSMKAKGRIRLQRKTERDEGKRGGTGPNGAKHGGRWHTPRPRRIPEKEMAEGNEEKEILKLLRGWQGKETSPIVRRAFGE